MRRTYKPGKYRFAVRRSKTGLGLYALDPIKKGACVIEYIGRPASEKEIREDKGRYLFWTSDTTMINGNIKENLARRINHSCVPNCESDMDGRRIYIFAVKDIRPGEEITYDYGDEYFDQHIRPVGCACPKCEKIRAAAKLSSSIRTRASKARPRRR